jgi:hypothetical protein
MESVIDRPPEKYRRHGGCHRFGLRNPDDAPFSHWLEECPAHSRGASVVGKNGESYATAARASRRRSMVSMCW